MGMKERLGKHGENLFARCRFVGLFAAVVHK